MNALPTVVRELRVGSRRWSTYWTRVGLGGGFLLLSSYIYLITTHERVASNTMGTVIFGTLIGVSFFYCLGTGIANTADCISQEKREGTLGLLFLTDLKGYDIVLGKLFAKGLVAFYSFLAGFPILATSFLLGGVTGTQFWQALVGLLNAFFFAHAAGLFSSVFSIQARKAHTGAVAVILLFAAAIPATVSTLHVYGIFKWDWLMLFSISLPIYGGSMSSYGSVWTFWLPLFLSHSVAWLLLGVASWRLPYCWQDRPKQSLKDRSRQFVFGSMQSRTALRNQLMEINPFHWLTSRSRFEPLYVWLGLVCIAIAWFWFRLDYPRSWQMSTDSWLPLYFATAFFLNFGFRVAIAGDAARHFEEQRLNGSLEFLLSCTPLSVPEILRGQWLTLRRKYLGPVIVVAIVDLLLVMYVGSFSMSDVNEIMAFFAMVFLLFPIDIICAAWVGMWCGLKSKKLRRGGGEAFGLVFFLPLLLFSLFMSFCGILLSVNFGFWQSLTIWVCFSVATQCILAIKARRILLKDFRVLASPLSEGTFRFWRAMGRSFGLLVNRMAFGKEKY